MVRACAAARRCRSSARSGRRSGAGTARRRPRTRGCSRAGLTLLAVDVDRVRHRVERVEGDADRQQRRGARAAARRARPRHAEPVKRRQEEPRVLEVREKPEVDASATRSDTPALRSSFVRIAIPASSRRSSRREQGQEPPVPPRVEEPRREGEEDESRAFGRRNHQPNRTGGRKPKRKR